MGLKSFSTNRENAVGDVKSRKKLDNLTISKESWRNIIVELDGVFPTGVAEKMTDEELKALIKLYDAEIEDETIFMHEDEAHIRSVREDLVEVLELREEDEEE